MSTLPFVFSSPVTITLPDGKPGIVTRFDGASYVLSDGRSFLVPDGQEPSTNAATIAIHVGTPPPVVAPVGIWTPLEFIERFTKPEFDAIFASADSDVIEARTKGLAAQEIRTDDPRTAGLMDLFVYKGLITSDRKTEILTP